MRVQIVTATVPRAECDGYLAAWREWSGTLYAMGVRTELLTRAGEPARFVELTWMDPGTESALADQRVVRAAQDMDTHATARSGALDLWDRYVS